MTRKWTVLALVPLLALVLTGCPKKQPKPTDEGVKMDTRAVEPPPSAPTQEIPPRPAPEPDQTEVNALDSEDLRVVNEEARRRGFTPIVYFDLDKSDLRAESTAALSRNAEFLRANPRLTVTVEGHCDERATNEYNLALGERRANAVKNYLVSLGVSADRMVSSTFGEERPVCTLSEESCWSQNRRAVLTITGRR
jgi:peptidoglycan-associated lipoprotein